MIFPVIVAAVFLLPVGPKNAHEKPESGRCDGTSWYACLPEAERGMFLKAFETALSLRERSDWTKLYDFMLNEEGISRKQFQDRMGKVDSLVFFHPASMTYIKSSDRWVIKGVARFKNPSHGREYSAHCSMRAYRVGNEWLFDNVALDVTGGK